jgi:hypothetical protein
MFEVRRIEAGIDPPFTPRGLLGRASAGKRPLGFPLVYAGLSKRSRKRPPARRTIITPTPIVMNVLHKNQCAGPRVAATSWLSCSIANGLGAQRLRTLLCDVAADPTEAHHRPPVSPTSSRRGPRSPRICVDRDRILRSAVSALFSEFFEQAVGSLPQTLRLPRVPRLRPLP